MNPSITLRPLLADNAEIQEAITLYTAAFPSCERREVPDWLKCIAHKANEPFTLWGIFQDELFAGFISSWDFGNFVYCEHFAVKQAIRGAGIGAKTMSLLKENVGERPLVLEVETPDNEMAIRRIGFYQRQGFVVDQTTYMQPPYRKEDEWFELKLMTTNPTFLATHFEEVKRAIYQNVYHVTEEAKD